MTASAQQRHRGCARFGRVAGRRPARSPGRRYGGQQNAPLRPARYVSTRPATAGVDGIPVNRGVWQPDQGQFDRDEYVWGGCGGAVAYRRAMLDTSASSTRTCSCTAKTWTSTGGRSWPATAAFLRPRPWSTITLSATGGGTIASFYTGRNTLWVLAKNYPGALFRKYWTHILRAQWAVTLCRYAGLAWPGGAGQTTRGQLAGLFGWPRMMGKRRPVRQYDE